MDTKKYKVSIIFKTNNHNSPKKLALFSDILKVSCFLAKEKIFNMDNFHYIDCFNAGYVIVKFDKDHLINKNEAFLIALNHCDRLFNWDLEDIYKNKGIDGVFKDFVNNHYRASTFCKYSYSEISNTLEKFISLKLKSKIEDNIHNIITSKQINQRKIKI